jgi:membrane protein implicated in regulation of membrane protease activity
MEARERVVALSPADAATIGAEHEARRAAMFVAAFVGVPAAVAAGTTIILSALTAAVLLAPVVAIVLTWVVWRSGRSRSPAA